MHLDGFDQIDTCSGDMLTRLLIFVFINGYLKVFRQEKAEPAEREEGTAGAELQSPTEGPQNYLSVNSVRTLCPLTRFQYALKYDENSWREPYLVAHGVVRPVIGHSVRKGSMVIQRVAFIAFGITRLTNYCRVRNYWVSWFQRYPKMLRKPKIWANISNCKP